MPHLLLLVLLAGMLVQSDMTAGGNTVEEEMWSIGNHSSSTGELRQLIRHIFGTRSEDDGKLGFGDTEANWCTAGFFCPDTVLPRYLTFLLRSLSPLRDGICGELACLSCSIHQPPSRRMTETDDLFCQLLKDMRIQLCTVGGVATQLHINSRRGKVQLPAVIAAYHELSALLEEATSLNATEQEFSTWTVCDPSQPKLWLQSSQYNITFDDILIYLTTIVDFLNAMAAMKDAAQYIHCKTRRLDDTVSSIMNIDSALYPSLYLPLAGRICLMSMDHINNDDLSQPWLYSCQEQREFQNMATSLLHVNKSMQRQDWLLNTWEDVCPSQSKQNSTPPAMDSHVATPHDHQLASDIAEICKTERPEIEACPEFGQAATYMPHEESHYLCFDTTCPYPAAIARSRPREDKPFSFIEEVHSSLRAYFNTSHLAISNQSNHLWSCHLHCKYSTQTLACVSELSVLLVIRNIGLWMGVLAFALSVWFVYKRKKLHRLHMPDQLLLVNNTLIIVSHTTVLIAMVLHRTHIGCRHDNTIVRGHREIGLLCASSALNSATVLQLQVVTWCMLAHSWKHLVKQVRNCVQGLAETVKSSYRHRLYYLLTAYTTFITSLLVVMAYAPQGIRVDNVVKLCKFIDRHPLLLIPKVLMIAVGCVWLYKGWRIFYITVNSNKRDLQQERSYRAHFCNQRPVLQYLVTDFLYLLIMMLQVIISWMNLEEQNPAALKEDLSDFVSCYATHCNKSQCPLPRIKEACWVAYVQLDIISTYLALLLLLLPYKNDIRCHYKLLVRRYRQRHTTLNEYSQKELLLEPLVLLERFGKYQIQASTEHIMKYERRRKQRVQRNDRLQQYRIRQKQKQLLDTLAPPTPL